MGTNENKRPNILWITSEDNSKHFLRLFDPAGAPMPNLEQLAADGIVFDRAFANAPVCSTARSTIISGCYGPRIGTQFHRRTVFAPMPDGLHMYPWYLRQAGYHTTNNVKTDYNLVDVETWDESSTKASWRSRAPGQPFFHIQNYTTTHESSLHFSADEMRSAKNETASDSITLFPYHPDTPTFRYTYARYHDRHRLLDKQIGELLAELEADGLKDDTIIFYFGDHGGVLPGSKGYLHEAGLHVPLVVWFPEKWRHLTPADPGSRIDGFVSFIDLAPTVLHLAGIETPAQMDGKPFLGKGIRADSLETRDEIYAYADRFDEKYDLVRSLRKGRFKYVRNYQPFNFDGLQNNYRYRMLAYMEWRNLFHAGKLNQAQSRFFLPRAPEELYDLETDPHQLHNLAQEESFSTTLEDMRNRLTTWVKGMPDLSFFPETVLVEEALDNPVAFGEVNRERIGRLVDIADLSLVPFEEARAGILRALRSDDPWERYWALIACSAHYKAPEELASEAREIADHDPVGLVRVRAAEFLALTGALDTRPVLLEAARSATDPVELNLILNTFVLLRDGSTRLELTIDPAEFPGEWQDEKKHEVARRFWYLAPPGSHQVEGSTR